MGKTQGFKVRVGVVLPVEGRILLARQNNRDFWVFPGGTLEPGETLEECAIREIREEAGLAISIDRLLYLTDFITPERQVVDVFFLGRYLSGNLTVTLEENINEMDFFSLEAMRSRPIQPALVAQRVLRDFEEGFLAPSGSYLGRYGT